MYNIDWSCAECKADTNNDIDYHMLQFDLWDKIAKKKEHFLCLDCVEKRLGRPIERKDLLPCPLNFMHPRFGELFTEKDYRLYGYTRPQIERVMRNGTKNTKETKDVART